MNQRTIFITIIIVLVAAGGYFLANAQQFRKTTEWLEQMSGVDDKEAAKAMEQLIARRGSVYQCVAERAQNVDAHVRRRVAVVLGQLGQPQAAEVLMPMLNDPEPSVRAAAAEALGQLGIDDGATKLAQLVASNTEELGVRISAARALASLAETTTVSQLTQAVAYRPVVDEGQKDDSWLLRVEAGRALGAVGTPEAVKVLSDELTGDVEPNGRVRTAMAYALGDAMTKTGAIEEATEPVLDALVQAASDKAGDVRIAAINSLLRIAWPREDSDRVEQTLTQAQSDPHYWVRYAVAPES